MQIHIREDINEKKNVFFRALPESPNPIPPDPNSGNLVLFFGRQNSRFESHLRTKSAKKNFFDTWWGVLTKITMYMEHL